MAEGLRVDRMRSGARDFIADERSTGTERDIGAFYYLLNRSGLSGQSLKSSQPLQILIFFFKFKFLGERVGISQSAPTKFAFVFSIKNRSNICLEDCFL